MKASSRIKVKVLPLDYWMTSEDTLEDCIENNNDYVLVATVFNRDGIYYDRKTCWFEVRGKAYSASKEMFEYRLELSVAERLNARQVAALKSIISQKLATKEQKTLYYRCRDLAQLKATSRNARLYRIKFDKECDLADSKGGIVLASFNAG